MVSSSAWEGFGLAILEAMLCERPIAATATDGAVELLQSNLVEIGKPEALAQMIENSLHSEQKNWIYPKAESFDWKYILAQWLTLYQSSAGKWIFSSINPIAKSFLDACWGVFNICWYFFYFPFLLFSIPRVQPLSKHGIAVCSYERADAGLSV